MPGVRNFDNVTESVDKMLKILKRQLESAHLMQDLRRKDYYVKPSVAKVTKSRRARKLALKMQKKR